MAMELRKAGSIWVDGDRFFDREVELASLSERVSDGIHTLLTAQRRMGKTSLVRELLRRLADGDDHETVFVDFEDAETAEDAVAELAFQAEALQSTSRRIRAVFANVLRGLGQNVEELAVSELRVKFRAGIDAGTWRRRGDEVFAALAESPKPVVLAIDELPIFVNRLLKGDDFRITPERRNNADLFMSWLRRNGQLYRGRVCIIVSGSIGLEPILGQAGLSAQANFLSPLELSPWSHETAADCLGALARSYGLDLSCDVRQGMCRRLRSCIPHHVQHFFDQLHEHLRREGRSEASLEDVEFVYQRYLLGVRGQLHLEHYEGRLRMVLGDEGYGTALELLTEAAVNDGLLSGETIEQYRKALSSGEIGEHPSIPELLYILEHDGYLEPHEGGFRFVSGLLEDWWRTRHREFFTPIAQR